MPKFTLTLFVVFALLIVTIVTPVSAQPAAKSGPDESVAQTSNANSQTDLKQVFDEETKKFNADSARFDPHKLEMEKNRRQAKRKWTGKDTALVVAIAVGVAALVFLLVKYGKECIRTSPDGCALYTDEYCTCAEYKQETQARGVR